jgi:uncharacterized membrane protein YeaQ/YmgE (transglycosylase-associated protein family)
VRPPSDTLWLHCMPPVQIGGWLGYLIAGFIGACLLIWVVRWIQGSRRTA